VAESGPTKRKASGENGGEYLIGRVEEFRADDATSHPSLGVKPVSRRSVTVLRSTLVQRYDGLRTLRLDYLSLLVSRVLPPVSIVSRSGPRPCLNYRIQPYKPDHFMTSISSVGASTCSRHMCDGAQHRQLITPLHLLAFGQSACPKISSCGTRLKTSGPRTSWN
jgi:hypothetical protein